MMMELAWLYLSTARPPLPARRRRQAAAASGAARRDTVSNCKWSSGACARLPLEGLPGKTMGASRGGDGGPGRTGFLGVAP